MSSSSSQARGGRDRCSYDEPSGEVSRETQFLRYARAGAERGVIFDHVTSRHADYVIERYHPLLDWRLALDMVRLALDPSAPLDLAQPYWTTLIQRTAAPYFQGLNYAQTTLAGLPAGHDPGTGEVLILVHPLWDQDPSNFRPEVARAAAEAEARGWRWKLRTVFRAVRFPYE